MPPCLCVRKSVRANCVLGLGLSELHGGRGGAAPKFQPFHHHSARGFNLGLSELHGGQGFAAPEFQLVHYHSARSFNLGLFKLHGGQGGRRPVVLPFNLSSLAFLTCGQ